MRRISFTKTQGQIRRREKTETRRLGWKNVKVGEVLRAVDRLRSKDAVTLAFIRVESTRWEPLRDITKEAVRREGFDGLSTRYFIDFFCELNKCTPKTRVNVITFSYVESKHVDVRHDGDHCTAACIEWSDVA